MRLIELSTVRQRLQVGEPLPFNVRQVDQTLLLARGQVVHSVDQMESLFERGMLVDLDELLTPAERARSPAPAELPGLWTESIDRVRDVLLDLPEDGLDAVEEVSAPLVALVERDPDLAIFQVLRQHGSRHAQYGVNHSIHCAIAAFVAALRLGAHGDELERAFKAALTMNVSMLELQGQLATQIAPPTPQQRESIHSHPRRSVEMLETAGVADCDWLRAIEHHHESGDGSGYPAGLTTIEPLADLLRQCDVYTAKLSPRRSREALAADVAARQLFAQSPGRPAATALIKEFGLYPPGTFVRLASGETAMVVRRGAHAHTPLVNVLSTARGATVTEPLRRDTAVTAHAVVAVLDPAAMRPVVPTEELMALICS